MVRDDAYNYLGIVIDSKLNWNYFEAACWGGNVSNQGQRRLDKVIHIASHILGRQTTSSLCIEGKCY